MTSLTRRILVALAVGLTLPASASAAVLDVPGTEPVLAPAPDAWIGEAINDAEICCKAADTFPIRAAVRVHRADGSGARTLAACARGRSAVVAVRGATAVFAIDCPGDAQRTVRTADLAGGGAPRVLAEEPGALLGLWVTPAQAAYSTVRGGAMTAVVLDLASGGVVREVAVPSGFSVAGLLDDGTLVLSSGIAAATCGIELRVVAPSGAATPLATACASPAVFGERIAYARAAAGGVHEIVVSDGAGARVVGVVRASAPPPRIALDGTRVAWTTDRCSDGARAIVVDLDAGDPIVGPGPATCPWSVAPRATVTDAGRLALTVRCAVGCQDLFHVTARGRTVALRRATVAPGEQVLELRMTRWARRALALDGRLRVRVHADRQSRAERVTVRMAG